jgi:prepilin-type N-terminal cleavage/methylation domain-containing protein
MGKGRKNNGFSLMEMLLSIGVLSVGMIFIAGVFPVAIHFSTVSTERTIAAVVADEAFAKIKI